jgi:HAD superfamily phosphatase (TIGR01668 family)
VADTFNRTHAESKNGESKPPLPEETIVSAAAAPAGHPHRRGLLIFCPHRMTDSVTQITTAELQERGIEGIILDLDNTLVLWQKEEMAAEVLDWLSALRTEGFKLCILSNSILSRRSERIAERLECPNVRRARKPSRSGFHRAMQAMETTPATTAIIGDQMFTDIWGGNRTGIYTIMVQPIHPREFIYTRFVSRPLERLLLHRFNRRGHL